MDHEHNRMGFGWCVFDWDGRVMGVVMFAKCGLYMVHEAEAVRAKEALSWIKGRGWGRVVLETDAQVVTRAVAADANISPFGAIIQEVRELLHELPMVTFRFVQRRDNGMAHLLAKKALSYIGEDRLEFFDCIPRFLSGSLCNRISR
ncbi:PREDICTED: uncharacterized protein LOC109146845 [Ipomoea nil]|uniref:uncharacterized protein LOC109146845 n=1 Tax=Ipomoea nil TaxID=35883 RepID=UPI0009018F00|nr:PREDICTED: uncharacterized protein LOC109146845 [Ipomoea nil]